jgi:hypothetical protein
MEKTILAHFTFPDQAEKARTALRAAGIDIVQVDTVDADYRQPQMPLVEWGRHGYEPETLDDKWTTAAAWDNGLGLNVGEAVLLTAVVDDSQETVARETIRQFGGRF